MLFVPDVDRWDRADGLLGRLLEDVDIAYVDGTFYDGRELPDRDLAEIPHPPVVDTMARLADRAWRDPGAIRFIHLNHTNPFAARSGSAGRGRAPGFAVARRGERVGL